MDYNELLDFSHVSTLENHRFLMYAHGVCVGCGLLREREGAENKCVCMCTHVCV